VVNVGRVKSRMPRLGFNTSTYSSLIVHLFSKLFFRSLGLGGLVVVTMYRKPEKWTGIAPKRAKSGAMGFPEDNAAASKL